MMKIAIKYPRKKNIEVENICDLKVKLTKLMIEEFDVKNSTSKPYEEIISRIKTNNITNNDFEVIIKKDTVIIPTEIKQCKVSS